MVGRVPRRAPVRERHVQHRPRDVHAAGEVARRVADHHSGQRACRTWFARPNLPKQAAPPIPMYGNFMVRDDFSRATLAPTGGAAHAARAVVDLAIDAGLAHDPARPVALSRSGSRRSSDGASNTSPRPRRPRCSGRRPVTVIVRDSSRSRASSSGIGSPSAGSTEAGRAGDRARVASADAARFGDGDRAAAERQRDDLPAHHSAPRRIRLLVCDEPGRWTPLLKDADGTMLSTKSAGGFVGTLFGLHAYGAPQ